MPKFGHRKYYSVNEAAWLLGVNPSKVKRAIRTGALPTIRRRSRLVVPDYALVRLMRERSAGGDA